MDEIRVQYDKVNNTLMFEIEGGLNVVLQSTSKDTGPWLLKHTSVALSSSTWDIDCARVEQSACHVKSVHSS